MEPGTLVALLKPLIDRAQPEWKKQQQALRQRFDEEVHRAISDHHVYVTNWCQEAHAGFLMGVPSDAPTIDLSFRTIPRRLGMVGGGELDEVEILTSGKHVAVLGDPGAGKTTTLRRLARWVALEPPVDASDELKYVVLIVCRDEEWSADKDVLYRLLGKKVGVSGKLFDDLDNPQSRIRQVLDVGALILIDGLDEVPGRLREDIERGIMNLGRHLQQGKIVLSCRSGDYLAPLPSFETAEIRPLTVDQIRRVVDSVLAPEEARAFYTALADGQHPAADLANRPLFLMYMLAIFKRRGTIPDRPIDLYEAITRLVIQEWDQQRGVRRSSKYAAFGVDDKRRFLADLAHELILRNRLRFDERELAAVYTLLADRYDLPRNEATAVARELESHTGLLVQSGELYEFSHLSLQEFLAADAMVRGSASARADWWLTHPEVAAVAVAMSSDANLWLDELMRQLPRKDLDGVRGIHSFLHRLPRERPRFVRSPQLGVVLLRLLFRAHIADPDIVAGLRDIKAIRDSVADALSEFNVVLSGDSALLLRPALDSFGAPDSFKVSSVVLATVVGEERLRQVARSNPNKSGNSK